MTEAFKCDRCGEFGAGESISTISVENSLETVSKLGDPYPIEDEYDLCELCSQSFQDWIDPSETDD